MSEDLCIHLCGPLGQVRSQLYHQFAWDYWSAKVRDDSLCKEKTGRMSFRPQTRK